MQSKELKLMLANNIWELIGKFFENVLFIPYNFFRLTIENWWTSNFVNWILIGVGFIALFYWMSQMYAYKRQGKEDTA